MVKRVLENSALLCTKKNFFRRTNRMFLCHTHPVLIYCRKCDHNNAMLSSAWQSDKCDAKVDLEQSRHAKSCCVLDSWTSDVRGRSSRIQCVPQESGSDCQNPPGNSQSLALSWFPCVQIIRQSLCWQQGQKVFFHCIKYVRKNICKDGHCSSNYKIKCISR